MSKRERLKESVRVATEHVEKLSIKLYEAEKDLTCAVTALRDHDADKAARKTRKSAEMAARKREKMADPVPPAVYMQGMLEGLVKNIDDRMAEVVESPNYSQRRGEAWQLKEIKDHLNHLLMANTPVTHTSASEVASIKAMKEWTGDGNNGN